MFFVSVRKVLQGVTPTNPDQLPRRVDFDFNDHEPSASVFACFRNEAGTYFEQGLQKFFDDINRRPHQHILFYIHGFNCQPEQGVFPMAGRLQSMFDGKSQDNVLVVPIIWACDTDLGIIKDYYDDQIVADRSGLPLARFWCFFMNWLRSQILNQKPFIKKVHVLAHSMGNRVFRNSMLDIKKYFFSEIPPLFKNSFLVAADVTNESLQQGTEGFHVVEASSWINVYYASDDLALAGSKWINLGRTTSSRLGHTGPEDVNKLRPTVLSYDCSDFNNRYDNPAGHTYFANDDTGKPGKVFEHIWAAIAYGKPPTISTSQRMIL